RAERDEKRRAREEEKQKKDAEKQKKQEEKQKKEEEKQKREEEKQKKLEEKQKKDEEKQKSEQLKIAYRKMLEEEKQAKDAEKLKRMEVKLQKQKKEEKEKKSMEDRLKNFLRKPSIVSQVAEQVIQLQSENNGGDINDFEQRVLKQDLNVLNYTIKDIISAQSGLTKDQQNSSEKVSSDNVDMKYIHFPKKYFIRPPYYGTFSKGRLILVDATEPYAVVDNTIDYDDDSVLEWDDGEEAEDCEGSDIDQTSSVGSDVADEDDELFISTIQLKQGREAAKSSVWDRNVQKKKSLRDLKPIFGCIYDNKYLSDQEKLKEISECQQYKMIVVPAEKANNSCEEKSAKVSVTPKQRQSQTKDKIPFKSQTKRSSSNKPAVESPSKRRKINVSKAHSDGTATCDKYLMTMEYEENVFKIDGGGDREDQKSKSNILEDTSNSKLLLTAESIDCQAKHFRTMSADCDNMNLQCSVNSADATIDSFVQSVPLSPPLVTVLVARRKN
ncbi:unnamed protein product, partial [Didymodactylos carnosus]